MPRETVFHLTAISRLPLIEEEGLRTRADLSSLYGPVSPLDAAAPGRFAHGKRVSAWLSEVFARTVTTQFGAGLVSFTVDPTKTLAAPASRADGEPAEYWAHTKPLAAWLADGDVPEDLEVHQHVPVRAKHVQLHAPLLTDEDLDMYAPLVAEIADEDRLAAKALMHLAIIAADGDFASVDFAAACALAWRDTPDPSGLFRELIETDPDKVASAVLAAYGTQAPEATERLRDVLEDTRVWADENGLDAGPGMLERSALVLNQLEHAR